MILAGHFLIHSDAPYEPWETTIAFSENKVELDDEASERNKEIEDSLKKFQNLSEEIEEYFLKFDDFRSLFNYNPPLNEFLNWIGKNPIPENLQEFMEFEEFDENNEYSVVLNIAQEHDFFEHYYVRSFGIK
jgi:hypothetical protein